MSNIIILDFSKILELIMLKLTTVMLEITSIIKKKWYKGNGFTITCFKVFIHNCCLTSKTQTNKTLIVLYLYLFVVFFNINEKELYLRRDIIFYLRFFYNSTLEIKQTRHAFNCIDVYARDFFLFDFSLFAYVYYMIQCIYIITMS